MRIIIMLAIKNYYVSLQAVRAYFVRQSASHHSDSTFGLLIVFLIILILLVTVSYSSTAHSQSADYDYYNYENGYDTTVSDPGYNQGSYPLEYNPDSFQYGYQDDAELIEDNDEMYLYAPLGNTESDVGSYYKLTNPEPGIRSYQYNQINPTVTPIEPTDKGLSFGCRTAIMNQDAGGVDVFCNNMDFMMKQSVKQNDPGGIDVFGGKQDFMCREAIKNQDDGGVFIFCN
jgi:hypothetical protein